MQPVMPDSRHELIKKNTAIPGVNLTLRFPERKECYLTAHSNSERGNLLPPHGLHFPISSKGSLHASSHRQDNIYLGLCYTSRGKINSSIGPP